ncbi:M17 family peptidase N-terminal domain-containing protein [Mucilaginibacter celer]|uniref:Peptidase M17 n=1 Tax=Mucilaginibacter celer TaxID=2305508 RepID=A0A494VZ22_9SPHI|nr:M17 family peptidase N-terminal domain-containing protein [Mucilaginibacter celer]AYL99381.1 peptidase M17 [Mucilaginibacter celer]
MKKGLTARFKSGLRFFSLLVCSLLISYGNKVSAQQKATNNLPAIGTSAILGEIEGIKIEAKVQSPSAELTPLQIVCVFEYVEGDIYTSPPALPANLNGMVHVDQQMKGLITELRKTGKFKGHALETLLISPPKGTIPAEKLLIIGLGDRNHFTPDLMTDVGRVGMGEALRLGVRSYAHASDLKDGGLDSPTGLIVENVLKGAIDAYRTAQFLKAGNYSTFPPLEKMTILAGPAFYDASASAISEVLQTSKK